MGPCGIRCHQCRSAHWWLQWWGCTTLLVLRLFLCLSPTSLLRHPPPSDHAPTRLLAHRCSGSRSHPTPVAGCGDAFQLGKEVTGVFGSPWRCDCVCKSPCTPLSPSWMLTSTEGLAPLLCPASSTRARDSSWNAPRQSFLPVRPTLDLRRVFHQLHKALLWHYFKRQVLLLNLNPGDFLGEAPWGPGPPVQSLPAPPVTIRHQLKLQAETPVTGSEQHCCCFWNASQHLAHGARLWGPVTWHRLLSLLQPDLLLQNRRNHCSYLAGRATALLHHEALVHPDARCKCKRCCCGRTWALLSSAEVLCRRRTSGRPGCQPCPDRFLSL